MKSVKKWITWCEQLLDRSVPIRKAADKWRPTNKSKWESIKLRPELGPVCRCCRLHCRCCDDWRKLRSVWPDNKRQVDIATTPTPSMLWSIRFLFFFNFNSPKYWHQYEKYDYLLGWRLGSKWQWIKRRNLRWTWSWRKRRTIHHQRANDIEKRQPLRWAFWRFINFQRICVFCAIQKNKNKFEY